MAPAASAALAEQLIREAGATQHLAKGRLPRQADRGSSLRSKPVAFLVADLGGTKPHRRPHTSDDNPSAEAQVKTRTDRPNVPARFGGIADARRVCQDVFPW